MDMQIQIDPQEAQARNSEVCAGCNQKKDLGMVVCWNCFKYRTDIYTLKEFNGTYGEWLEYLKNR